MSKVESVWHGFLRRMVNGGFIRRNAPKNKKDTSIPEDQLDWAYKINNKRLREITKTTEIKLFCQVQHLKYIDHITRSNNDSLQKQFLFLNNNNPCCRWKKLANLIGIDESQLMKTMLDRKEFQRLLDHDFK